MPPRRAARAAAQEPFEELDSNAARPPARRTAAAAAKANANKPAPTRRAPAATKQAPTRAAGRTTRKRVVQDSESEEEKEEGDEDEAEGPARAGSDAASDDDDDDSEDDEPVKPRARGKTLAAGRQASAARRAARVSAASSIAKSEDAEDDDDEEEEEAEEPVKSARASRARAAAATTSRTGRGKKTAEPVLPLSPSPTPSVAATASEDDSSEEEEEEASEEEEGASAEEFEPAPTRKRGAAAEKRVSLAPASAKAAARRRSVLPTPDPESSAAEEDATETEGNADEDDEEDEDEDEDDDATPQPPPVRKVRGAAKGKGKARAVVASSDEGDEEEEAEAEAKVEPTPPNGEAVPPSPTPSNRGQVRSRSSTPVPTPAVAAEAAAAVAQPPPSPVKPSPPTALTASALASIARQAAIDHAAHAVQRAEEMKGKPRLVIHQLVLENFKSYKGRAIIGPFHKSFSAIVGPNGSGKSNTIDALLFVFGFRANKMRQGKFSELIHNSGAAAPAGSSTAKEGEDNGDEEDDEGFFDPEEYDSDDDEAYRKGGSKGKGKGKGKAGKKRATERYAAGGCEYATVEIWFREIIESADSVDDWNVVPNSGLVVARTVRRDNTTRYTVNGKSASPGEVKQLLLGRGIDLTHNRFLILQGEVESIAQMKPKGATEHEEGLLEYLEDIIGTNRYEKLIEEAAVDVERLGDERQVQMNRVKLVEKEKGALEARKKAADAYIRDQLELVRLQNQLYQRHAHQAGADRLLYEEQAAEAKAELDAELERQKVDRERYEADSAAYESTKQHLKEIEEAANAFAKDLATFEKAKVQLTVQKKAADTKYSKLKKQLEEDKHAAQQAQSDIRDHTDTLDKLISGKDKFKDELEQEQAALTKVMDGLRDKIEGFSLEIEQHQKSLAPWHEQIEAKQNEIKIATQQLEDLRGKSAQIQADIERIEEEIEADRVAAKEKAQELKALHASRKEMDERIEQARTRVQKEKATENKQRAAVSNAREKSVEAKASQQASQSKGHVLSSVLKLKEQGRLPGFHGRLGDLGRIDDKYDVAISTAAASGLESLIVDTRETAEAIFDHLRKHNIGRASCIALDRFGKLDLSPIRTPANTNRLFDLVTPKEQMYAPAFRHILKDTLVAPSWDVGQPVSTGKVDGQRWRVVTLDGNIAEKSGAAQVGGSRPIRGKMSSKIQADDVSPQQLAKLEADEKAAVVKLDEVVELSKAAETDLRSLQKELAQIDAAIPKIEMDLEANKQDGEQKAELLAELRSQSKPNAGDVKRIAQLEKAIEALDGELETLRGKASKYEEKISALQGKIEEVGGLKLRSQKAKVSDLQEQIRHNETRLVKAKTERAKAEKDLAKSTKAIEANSAKAEELEAEIADLRMQLAATEQEAEPIRQTVEQAQAGVEDGREQLANLKAELDEQEDAIIEFKKAEAELKGAFAEQEKLLRESTRIFEYWSAKIGELQLPDFEMLEPEEGDDDEEVEKPPRVEEILRQLEPDEIASVDLKKLKGQIALIEERLERNNADLAVLQEYKRRDEEFRKRAEEFESVSRQWDAAKTAVTELRNERLVQFMQGFGIISNKLKEMYQMITLGGNAELELYDSADPFSEGILFSVMPPKKSWKNISNLSGGEKTLSSLALVFALHTYKPTPIYLLDEVDAALDFRNVSIVANYIKARCAQQAQFIVISLRNNLFELANRLVGVYKVENCTRSVAIDNTDLAAIADVDPAGKA